MLDFHNCPRFYFGKLFWENYSELVRSELHTVPQWSRRRLSVNETVQLYQRSPHADPSGLGPNARRDPILLRISRRSLDLIRRTFPRSQEILEIG